MNDRKECAAVAARFAAARRTASALDSFPGQIPATLEEAYAIQDAAIADWNLPVLGWKIGRILPPLDQRFGTDRLAGPVFRTARAEADAATPMPVFEGGFAAAEAEFLVRIGETPAAGRDDFPLEELDELIDAVHIGMEIASSPLASLNQLGPTAVISDFGNNNGLLIGPEIADWQRSELEHWPVGTIVEGQTVGLGKAADLPQGLFGAVRFLLVHAARRGLALKAGQWIATGAVGGVHPAASGQTVEARFGEHLSVSCRLIAARPEAPAAV